jgi:hypothetical protein
MTFLLKNLSLIFVFLFISQSCISQKAVKSANKSLTVYKTDNYSIKYPKAWTLTTVNEVNAEFFLTASGQEGSDFYNNFNLMIQDLSITGENIDIERYTEITKVQIEENIGKDALLYVKNGKNTFGEFRDISYSGNFRGIDIKWKQRYYIVNNKAYLLTYTAHISTFDKHLVEMDAVFESFKLK